MATSNFNLKNIPSEVMTLIKIEAKRLQINVNTLLLKLIKQGLQPTHKRTTYHDIDHLAGSWSREEEKEFFEPPSPKGEGFLLQHYLR